MPPYPRAVAMGGKSGSLAIPPIIDYGAVARPSARPGRSVEGSDHALSSPSPGWRNRGICARAVFEHGGNSGGGGSAVRADLPRCLADATARSRRRFPVRMGSRASTRSSRALVRRRLERVPSEPSDFAGTRSAF